MTRLGINPARGKATSYRPARVTLALLTYIPHLEGYFRHRLEVLRLVLHSLRAHTTLPHDLLVFDNGSCPPVVDYLRELRDAGGIDYLLLSRRNIGKIGAFKILFHAAPGEIVAYSDDDVFFYPGWLEAHLQILEAFPRVGMVSGQPVRHASSRARTSLQRLLENPPAGLSVSHERRIPDEWEADWALSTGRDPEAHLRAIQQVEDTILHLNGVEAFASASHFQFLAPREVLLAALPKEWSGRLMGQMIELDEAVDALGYLRLATPQRCTRHLGNVLTPEIVAEARSLGLDASPATTLPPASKHWLLHLPGSGRVLRWVYNRLFQILHMGG